mgnify:CR=1 FL=1
MLIIVIHGGNVGSWEIEEDDNEDNDKALLGNQSLAKNILKSIIRLPI